MVKVEREKIIKRVASYSAAAHYCSSQRKSRNHEEVERSLLFTTHREGLVSLWIDDACHEVLSHLTGWVASGRYDDTGLSITLHQRYAEAEQWLGAEAERMIALDVWSRICAATDAREAEECRRRYSAVLFSVLSRLML